MILTGRAEGSMTNINKKTKIYGSFSKEPGNWGCRFHNRGFQNLGIDAIYRSFGVDNIREALDAMRVLGISGAGISMPFKKKVISHVDACSGPVRDIGAANTIINNDGHLIAYNTDWIAAEWFLKGHQSNTIYILGNGGYSQAVQYACKTLEMEFELITRTNWGRIQDLSQSVIFNCTPLEKRQVRPVPSNHYIDCLITTPMGQRLASIQAAEQFKLYTGKDYPCLNSA